MTGAVSVRSGEVALDVQDAVLQFGGIRALDGVSFSVQPHETFGIVGPNGAGKTALLNCVSGIYRLNSGRVSLFGEVSDGWPAVRVAAYGVARTFQSTEHFKEFLVVDYIMLGRLRQLKASVIGSMLAWPLMERGERRERAYAMTILEKLGMERFARVPLADLPYGAQKLVDIARAIAAEPRLILLDEPTSGTTSSERGPVGEAVTMVAEMGIPTVIVDHDVDFVSHHCQRMLVVNFGKPLGVGTPAEMLARPDVSEAFLGITL